MASFADNLPEFPQNTFNATAAPPPTPSTQPNHHLATSSTQADALSRLLLRLPPSLSLPNRRRNPPSQSPPVISLSDPTIDYLVLSSGSKFGFFELINHEIALELAESAETESISLFELTKEEKESNFQKNWPLGFSATDEFDENRVTGAVAGGESFSLELKDSQLNSLHGFSRVLEKLGLKNSQLNSLHGISRVSADSANSRAISWLISSKNPNFEPEERTRSSIVGSEREMTGGD